MEYKYIEIKRCTVKKFLAAFCLLVLAACSSEERVGPEEPVDGDAKLTINITFPSEGTLSTKAFTEDNEKEIKRLRIFVFDNEANQPDSKFLYEVETVPVPTGSGDVKSTTVTLRKMTAAQRLVLVANLPAGVTVSPVEGQTLSTIFTPIVFSASGWLTDNLSLTDATAFPMWGQMKTAQVITESTGSINVNMFRALARVDVGVDMDNASSTLVTDFKINTVYVCNPSASGYLTPHADYMSGSGIDATIIGSSRAHATKHTSDISYAVSDQRKLERAIYIPESDVKDSPSGNTAAFLVVKATYKGQADCYYRIDFANGGSFIPVLRNHKYRFNITKVNSYGYGSLTDAKNSEPSIIAEDLVVENVNSVINEIAYNDTDMFGISVSEILFDWDKVLVGENQSGDEQYILDLFSTYASWTATIDGSPGWFTLVNGSEMASVTKTNIAGTLSSLTIRVKSENLTGTEREGSITLKSGMLTHTIRVRQSGGANSYLVRFGSGNTATLRIPVPFATKALEKVGAPMEAADVRVLWYEAKEASPVTFTVSMSGNYVTVTATSNGSTYNGNAVIALVKGSGIGWVGSDTKMEIVYSWHVWTMPGGSDMDASFHDPNKDKLMRRTLGKYDNNKGMFYQWGRKDPFPQHMTDAQPRVVAIEATTTDNTEAYVIQHPNIFYTDAAYWLAGTVAATRWTASTKSEYNDPCPTGWRVPGTNDSYEWTIPASVTDYQNGLLSGTTGDWTSSPHRLWIATGTNYSYWTAGSTISTATSSATTPGHNLRCIKDIKLIK